MDSVIIGSDEWLEIRKKYITATDMCVIMGVSKWTTPLQLYKEKTTSIKREQSYVMKRGLDMEEEARRLFEKEMDTFVVPKFVTKDGWMAASLDGISEDEILVEIKCPGAEDHEIALKDVVPKHYYPQIQWQMAVTDLKVAYYFSYNPHCPVQCCTVTVHRDEEYIEKMKVAANEFRTLLKSHTLPEASEKDIFETNDSDFLEKEEKLSKLLLQREFLDEQIEALKKDLISKCSGTTKGRYLKLTQIQSKGKVDYSAIPELKEMDLEPYRKKSTMSWRVDQIVKI
jgi:putative phage-type endonuclease